MARVNEKLIEQYAELCPALEKRDARDNPGKVVELALNTEIDWLDDEDGNEQATIAAEQERLKNKWSDNPDSSVSDELSRNAPIRERANDNEVELSKSEEDEEISELQEEIAARIFGN